jgi:tRNA acetyltransferase TAN1
MDYNLLATTEPIYTSQACSELWINLRAIGDETPKTNRSRIKGVILGKTEMDPVDAIHSMKKTMETEPAKFKVLYRVLPIQKWVTTEIPIIVEAIKEMISIIGQDDSFRITLEKRRSQLRSLEIITPVAEVVDRSVDLENPDWVILIEIMGKETGVSVIKPNDMLNIQKERYRLSVKAK